MTAASLIGILVATNLAGGLAVLAVLALRGPARAVVGARAAYAIWLIVPAVMAAVLLPARTVTRLVEQAPVAANVAAPGAAIEPPALVVAPDLPIPPLVSAMPSPVMPTPAVAPREAVVSSPPEIAVIDWTMLAAVMWILGAIAALVTLMVRQANAVRALGALTKVSGKASRAAQAFVGPAVVGVLKPQIVLPADFEALYEPVEQKVVLAHEEEHVRGRHTLVKTLVEVAVCLNWFNPLAYLASRAIAMDQELACDEAVAARYPGDRRAYASALLKAQAGMRAPLGCYWPATSADQLKQRITRLKLSTPSAKRRIAGMGVMAVLAAASALSAWAVRPPQEQVNIIPAHADPAQLNTASAAQLADQPAPAPEPQQSPQQTPQPTAYTKPIWSERIVARERMMAPARPRSPVLRKNVPAGFDPFDPLYIRGKVERIEFTDTRYTVFLRASSLAAGSSYPARADTSLWKLPPTSYWGDRDAVTKDLANRSIHVSGFNALDKSCAPTCSLHVTLLIVPGSTALPPISQTPNFGFNDLVTYYNQGPRPFNDYSVYSAQQYGRTIYGLVTRIEFGDRMFDAYVQQETVGPVSGALYQVRSEYRFPRAEIEKQLVGKTIAVAGWPVGMTPGKPTNKFAPIACETVCGLYGSDFTLANGTKLTPAGATLVADASTFDPGAVPIVPPNTAYRLANYDRGAPLMLTGVVTKISSGPTRDAIGEGKLWVRVTDTVPADTPGGAAGREWVIDGWKQVFSSPSTFEGYVGHTVEITGFNARDKTCNPDCIMTGEQITVKD